jgi:sulfate/thiosulfate-binding protein
MKNRMSIALGLLFAALALVVAGCGGSSDSSGSTGGAGASSSGSKGTLSLVAYSTPQVAYDLIEPGFQKTAAGEGIGFKSSYGASGDQSRAVAAGQAADIVAFSLEPDMTRLVRAGLVGDDWNRNATRGFVTNSVVAFVVRRGNPKNIKTWADLLKPGVQVLTPNPFSSGGARWNLMAAYGQAAKAGSDPAAGLAYVKELLTKHVKVQDRSGRESLQNFLSGNGDVSISYENEAITAQRRDAKVDYVVPDDTLLIQNPIAVVRTSKNPTAARAFVDYALSPPGQRDFASWGYRPVDQAVLDANKARFPTPPGLFTIDQLGGWSKVNDEFFDPDRGSITKIEQDAGVSTSK